MEDLPKSARGSAPEKNFNNETLKGLFYNLCQIARVQLTIEEKRRVDATLNKDVPFNSVVFGLII